MHDASCLLPLLRETEASINLENWCLVYKNGDWVVTQRRAYCHKPILRYSGRSLEAAVAVLREGSECLH